MAEQSSAKVYKMNDSPDLGDENATPPGNGVGGSKAPVKRKKKIDSGKLATLHRDWALQFCTQVAWNRETRKPYSIAGLRNQFGNDEVRMWLTSANRQHVTEDQIVFDPAGHAGPECINLFAGFESVPKQGDCSPITDLLMHLVNDDFDLCAWLLDWIAYPLQNPGAKMPTSIIMHGDEGSGKSMFWEIVAWIYGEYASVVGQDQLEDKFNDYLSRKCFIIGDEVLSRSEMRHLKGKLKGMISGKTIQINTKMMPLRTEANHVNIVFLSNELQPNALDASDRRYFVIWTPPKLDQDFYHKVGACIKNGGREAFHYNLLHRDLKDFDAFKEPPKTAAKSDLIDLGRPNAERWFLAWQAGDLALPFNSCASEQAYRFYARWCRVEGERTVFSRNYFSRAVMRLARDKLGARVTKLGSRNGTGGTSARMWLVTPPPQDVDFAEFSKDCFDAFEGLLKDYIGNTFDKS